MEKVKESALILKAEKRNLLGKKVKKLREQGKLPAVLYGHQISSEPLILDRRQFEKIYQQAGTSSLVDLQINNKTTKVLIHEPQRNPVTDQLLHADLYQVKMTEKIKTEIPLKFTGTPPAVEQLQGNLLTNKTEVNVECLPQDLVNEIEVDLSNLRTFEDKITITSLKVPSTITVLDEPEEIVAQVLAPRTEEELEKELKEEGKEAEETAVAEVEAKLAEEKKAEEAEEKKEETAPTPAARPEQKESLKK